jgi:hypothetical protein
MICPTCQRSFPDCLLACRDCAERLSREAMLEQQRQHFDDLFSGRSDFTVVRPGRGKYHIALIGDPRYARCGQPLAKHRTRVAYSQLLPDTLCPGCRTQLAALRGIAVETL